MERRETYTAKEAAAKLGINITSVYEGLKKGEIPSIKIGNRVLIPRAAFDRLLVDRI